MRNFAPAVALIGVLFLGAPVGVFALEYDASISQGSIAYSESQLYAGELMRVYGTIVNKGTKDISGTLRFFQGAVGIGESLPFSLKAGSAHEELWTDWRPSEGTYNLMMTIVSTNPGDENPDNNTAVTPMMTVVKRPSPPPPPSPPQPVVSRLTGSATSTIDSVAKASAGSDAKKSGTQKTTVVKKEPPKPSRQTVTKPASEPPRNTVAQKTGESTLYDQEIPAQPQSPSSEFVPVPEQDTLSEQPAQKKQDQQPPPWGIAVMILLSVASLGTGLYFWKRSKSDDAA